MTIPSHIETALINTAGISHINQVSVIQSLWSGYGQLLRVSIEPGIKLTDQRVANTAPMKSVIVKHIQLPCSTLSQQSDQLAHPRGWNTQLSHQRKLDSYAVEQHWYQSYANQCHSSSYLPQCIQSQQHGNDILLILEDLACQGFTDVYQQASAINHDIIKACLQWLAQFHGQFINHCAQGLWPIGSYWHLATRPDEYASMPDSELKRAASAIDNALNQCQYQTIIHGDAKLANFCINPDNQQAAAVDFQYVGKGCGIKDVVMLLSSTLDFSQSHQQLDTQISRHLEYYFDSLKTSIQQYKQALPPEEVITEWRDLFHIAWADFQRFLLGWSPNHAKNNSYTQKLTNKALKQLK
ncbi:phosphotransferase [Shewanella maritima]|uniref:phosphotransferase n=1 Tax=Shewanella maritima TaxID=2520507 RepID=UPI00373604DA